MASAILRAHGLLQNALKNYHFKEPQTGSGPIIKGIGDIVKALAKQRGSGRRKRRRTKKNYRRKRNRYNFRRRKI